MTRAAQPAGDSFGTAFAFASRPDPDDKSKELYYFVTAAHVVAKVRGEDRNLDGVRVNGSPIRHAFSDQDLIDSDWKALATGLDLAVLEVEAGPGAYECYSLDRSAKDGDDCKLYGFSEFEVNKKKGYKLEEVEVTLGRRADVGSPGDLHETWICNATAEGRILGGYSGSPLLKTGTRRVVGIAKIGEGGNTAYATVAAELEGFCRRRAIPVGVVAPFLNSHVIVFFLLYLLAGLGLIVWARETGNFDCTMLCNATCRIWMGYDESFWGLWVPAAAFVFAFGFLAANTSVVLEQTSLGQVPSFYTLARRKPVSLLVGAAVISKLFADVAIEFGQDAAPPITIAGWVQIQPLLRELDAGRAVTLERVSCVTTDGKGKEEDGEVDTCRLSTIPGHRYTRQGRLGWIAFVTVAKLVGGAWQTFMIALTIVAVAWVVYLGRAIDRKIRDGVQAADVDLLGTHSVFTSCFALGCFQSAFEIGRLMRLSRHLAWHQVISIAVLSPAWVMLVGYIWLKIRELEGHELGDLKPLVRLPRNTRYALLLWLGITLFMVLLVTSVFSRRGPIAWVAEVFGLP